MTIRLVTHVYRNQNVIIFYVRTRKKKISRMRTNFLNLASLLYYFQYEKITIKV